MSIFSGFITFLAYGVPALTIAGLGALYYFQDQLLYYPHMPPGARSNFYDPKEFGLGDVYEEIFFYTPDKVKIQAWLFKVANKDAPTVLYFQGNAGNISFCLPNVVEMMKALECNVMLISYRGYGKSEGFPNEKGLRIDAQASLDYLLARPDINPHKIALFGRSLGGAVSVQLCHDNQDKIKALILENTFTSIPDMVGVVFPVLRHFTVLSTNKWHSEESIEDISVPILFLSGKKDELVPTSQMERLYAKAVKSPLRKIEEFPAGYHMDTWTQPRYYESLASFFKDIRLQ
eukprot:TRINITY_DN4600_c0_g1_i1.p1 TRINITY_DN4600_c0_g1~~TRINITY_DN4600_c0_g1_i1.p1  ORF type:complete len:290 (+),score=47.95 TRINITY_DN4600_c0_g1_i1:92-961(+)